MEFIESSGGGWGWGGGWGGGGGGGCENMRGEKGGWLGRGTLVGGGQERLMEVESDQCTFHTCTKMS